MSNNEAADEPSSLARATKPLKTRRSTARERRESSALGGHSSGLETGLAVTSVRVHPKVMEHVRDLCERANVSFNQLLILAVALLEGDPVVQNLTRAQQDRVAAQGEFARRMQRWSEDSRVGPRATGDLPVATKSVNGSRHERDEAKD